ncbi:MAG: hypothetical protein QGG36_24915 [Pirellulaceae bacterium]|jgi:hypothetical protein|nr:hypothetical protein [Pirellulaceae bacterium]MDP7019062.1 hypothetical protein [Pirellulaceae bacterium]
MSNDESLPFVERRNAGGTNPAGTERRQFSNSYSDLSPAAAELGRAIDSYKAEHRRRVMTYEEILEVVTNLGYQKA